MWYSECLAPGALVNSSSVHRTCMCLCTVLQVALAACRLWHGELCKRELSQVLAHLLVAQVDVASGNGL